MIPTLLRIDACPIQEDKLSFPLISWLSLVADSINGAYDAIEYALFYLVLTGLTQTEITAAFTDGQLSNGVLLYDTTNNVYVGMQAGSLVKFTTTAWP